MQLTLRPYVTTGIALVGASAIALTPITPTPAALSAPAALSSAVVSNASVALTAAATSYVDPITRWVQVIDTQVKDIVELGTFYMQRPFPIVGAMFQNLLTYGRMIATALPATATNLANWATGVFVPYTQRAIAELLAGKPQQAAATFTGTLASFQFSLMPAMDLLKIPNLMLDHVYTVAKEAISLGIMANLVGVPLNLATIVINDVGASVQDALNAFNAGDPIKGLTALANIPANVTQTTLNFFTNFGYWGACGCKPTGGWIFSQVIKRLNTLADKILIPVAPAAAAASIADTSLGGGTLVALNASAPTTDSGAAAPGDLPAASDPAPETPAEDTSSTDTTDVPADVPAEEAAAPAETDTTDTTDTDVTDTETETSPEVDAPSNPGKSNGATDLSGGNKVTPGQTHSNTKGSESGNADDTEPPAADDASAPSGSDSGAAAGGADSGSDSAGGNDAGSNSSGGSDE